MFEQTQTQPIKDLVKSAQSVAILLPPEPSTDLISAGLGLHLSLQQAGKFSQIGCSSPLKVENADLFGIDQIRNTIGNQNLVITFDFKEENLKKVDYDVDENGKFTLLIQPQPGTPPPDSNSVNFSYSGASADLVFILGVNSLEELGKIYADEKQFLDQSQTVSINASPRPATYAKHDLSSADGSCAAELVALLLRELEIDATEDAASNLLSTIYTETKQFTSNKAQADTFEVVAYLMRHGGNLPNSSPFGSSSRFGAFPPPAGGSPFGANPFAGSPMNPPMFDDDLLAPMPAQPAPTRIPNDWQKPKIFRTGSRPVNNRNNNNRPGGQMGPGQGMTPASSL